MGSVVDVNPFRCRMWEGHDRLEDYVDERTCAKEIESFLQYGQLVPAVGRLLSGVPDYDVEIVCGARRLFVARHVNKPLRVDLREMSDRDAIVAMDMENRQRMDISAYERGLSFKKWLNSGHFESQEALANALNVSASMVSRLLKAARLPAAVLDAFGDPTLIRESWAVTLFDSLAEPDSRQRILRTARSIAASKRPPPEAVYARLTGGAPSVRAARLRRHDDVVKSPDGVPIFRIRQLRNHVAILLPAKQVTQATLSEIRNAISVSMTPPVAGPLDLSATRTAAVTAGR